MQKLSAGNLISFINELDKNQSYNYINPKTKGLIKIEGIDLPEGPIRIKRWDPSKGETSKDKKVETISSELVWRIANAFNPNQPINFDRILGGSYNTRSVFEALLAHTPQFYYCYPGRIENKGNLSSVKHGHKHIIWQPETPHRLGVLQKAETDIIISEMPVLDAFYDSLILPDPFKERKRNKYRYTKKTCPNSNRSLLYW